MQNYYVIQGAQCFATGVFCYEFKIGGREIGSVSYLVVPRPDVAVECGGKTLYHKALDTQVTYHRGLRRELVWQDSTLYGYFVMDDLRDFKICVGNTAAVVRSSPDGWDVFAGTQMIAQLTKTGNDDRTFYMSNGYETRDALVIKVALDFPAELYPLLLAIPVLKF